MNPTESSEPTTFALDVYFAAGARGDAALAAHVEGCARCAAYLAQLSAQPQQAAALPPPMAAKRPRQRSAPRWIAASAALSACACAILAVWLRGGEYVGSKGVPAVQALIRGSDRARVWDGKTPIRAGDAIALRTGCDRFTHVTVVVARSGERGGWARVFDGPCSEQEPLPFTLVADHQAGSERIDVVFSRAALDDAALHRALSRSERSETVWVNQLVLHKSGAKP